MRNEFAHCYTNLEPSALSGLSVKSVGLVTVKTETRHRIVRMIRAPLSAADYLNFGGTNIGLGRVRREPKVCFVKLIKPRDAHATKVSEKIDKWAASKGGRGPSYISGLQKNWSVGF
jgi:hypothetical protein